MEYFRRRFAPGLSLTAESLATVNISGTPITQGTYTFTVQVLDVCGVAATQSYTLVVGAATDSASALAGGGVNNAMMQGNYAFQFSGFGPRGITAEAGSFTADGKGNITAGTLDRNGAAGPQSKVAFTGTYGIGANQLGVMTLKWADGTSNTYALAVSLTGDARYIEFDDTTGTGTRGSGEMKKRDPGVASGAGFVGDTAGSYVLELTGVDASGARLAMAGQFSMDESGAVIQSELDANDAGTMETTVPFSGAANFIADGSGTAAWNVPGFGTIHLSLYAVSADEAFAVGMDAGAPGVPLMAGSVLRQSGGPFTSTTMSGSAVIQMTGFATGKGTASGGATGTVGVLQLDSTGGAEELALQTGHGSQMNVQTSFVMSASGEGRIALGSSGLGIVYLASPTKGFVLGTDAGAEAGTLESQTGTIASGFKGALVGASEAPIGPGLAESIYSISFDGDESGTLINAASDSKGLATNVGPPIGIAYSISNGAATITGPSMGGNDLYGVIFIVSPGNGIYLPMGPLASAPIFMQN